MLDAASCKTHCTLISFSFNSVLPNSSQNVYARLKCSKSLQILVRCVRHVDSYYPIIDVSSSLAPNASNM